MITLEQQVKDVRRASAPLALITTADPAATIKAVVGSLNGKSDTLPLMQHDVVKGLEGIRGSEPGRRMAGTVANDDNQYLANPVECMATIYKAITLSKEASKDWTGAVIFMHNAHKYLPELPPMQAVWNLRDVFKNIRATLVLLAPSGTLPDELRQDVIVIEDPLPAPTELCKIAGRMAEQAQKAGADIDPDEVGKDERLGDTLTGTSAFGAEQVLAMAMRKRGIDREVLGDRKRKLVEQTQGLSVWEGGETFDQLGGLANLKEFLTSLLTSGNTPVRAIGFLDEIEKMLAGSGSDSSGTSQDQLMVFLREMQDNNTAGIILLGVGGTGKSAIAKASGRIAQAPVLNFDLGAAKGSLVGESEGRIRAMMQVFQAVSQGKGLFIATCNQISSLPPELRRRFKLGTFFVDLPTAKERKQIWEIWRKRFGIKKQTVPASVDWSGAEIAACCEVAFRTNKTLVQAADFVVPIAKSAPDKVEGLRRMASGKFLSASAKGFYQHKPEQETAAEGSRQLTIE